MVRQSKLRECKFKILSRIFCKCTHLNGLRILENIYFNAENKSKSRYARRRGSCWAATIAPGHRSTWSASEGAGVLIISLPGSFFWFQMPRARIYTTQNAENILLRNYQNIRQIRSLRPQVLPHGLHRALRGLGQVRQRNAAQQKERRETL